MRKAINDIGIADISGTLTTVLVFFPLLSVTGVLGDFIKILPVTVILALILSLVIALTVLPFISIYMIPDSIEKNSKSKKISFSQYSNIYIMLFLNWLVKSEI